MNLINKLETSLQEQFGEDEKIVLAAKKDLRTCTWAQFLVIECELISFVIDFTIREEETRLINVYPINGFVSSYVLRRIDNAVKTAMGE